MSYEKQGFASGDVLYATQLNAMDDQIADNEEEITGLKSALNLLQNATAETVSSKNYFSIPLMDFSKTLNASNGIIGTTLTPESNTMPVSPRYNIEGKTGNVVGSGAYNGNRMLRSIRVCFYESDMTFISGSNSNVTGIPQNAAYMVFAVNSAFWTGSGNSNVQVEITDGNTYTSYEEYFESYLANNLEDDVNRIEADVFEDISSVEEFTIERSSTEWKIINYPVVANVAYTIKNCCDRPIWSNIYGYSGATNHAIYAGEGTTNIKPGESIIVVPQYNDTSIRYYGPAGTDIIRIAKINSAEYLKYAISMITYLKDKISYGNLRNKTWNAVGDSITYQGRYIMQVTRITGLRANNCGIGGTTIAINNSQIQTQSFVERVLGLNGNTPYQDADIWTVMGGLNDCMDKSPLGAIAPIGSAFDNTTVYGALQSICEYILNLRAHPRLLLLTPTQSVRDGWVDPETYTPISSIRQAIIDVGAVYSIPVVDVWKIGGISRYNIQKSTNPTTSDGVHINDLGAEIMSPCIADAVEKAFYGVL